MLQFIHIASFPEALTIPLFTERCAAGFPSPAADYTGVSLDIENYCTLRLKINLKTLD